MLSAVGIVTAQTLGFTEVTVAIGDYCSSITVRVCSRLIESISLDNDRYHIWSYSGFFDQYTKNDEKKYIWTIDGHTNTDSVCFKSILFDSECQSIVFDQYIPQHYRLYFDPTGEQDNRKYINWSVQNGSTRVTYSTSPDNATDWFVEYYGAYDTVPSSEIIIYTIVNNSKKYLVFCPVTQDYAEISLLSSPANNDPLPVLFATPAVSSDADIALLSVSRPGISGVTIEERANGWLDLINGAESLPDEVYGSSFQKTLNAKCGRLDSNTVYERFQNSRIIILRGHGSEGRLYYDEECYEYNKLTAGEISNSSFPETHAEIVIYGSCYSGAGGTLSLVDRTSAKGVPIVIGFTDVLNRQAFAIFQYLFFEEYNRFLNGETYGSTIQEIAEDAYSQAYSLVFSQGYRIGDDNTPLDEIVYVTLN